MDPGSGVRPARQLVAASRPPRAALRLPERALHAVENALDLARFIGATQGTDIHLMGHSLGGLVILQMLAQAADPRLPRVVLFGAPHCPGSHCARHEHNLPLFYQEIARYKALQKPLAAASGSRRTPVALRRTKEAWLTTPAASFRPDRLVQ